MKRIYCKACRELHPADCQIFKKLLREMATNTVMRRLAWNLKTDFLTLWFISAGRFPNLPATLIHWCIKHLPFELSINEQEILFL